MPHDVEFNLALILFLPWFAILCALFWMYPRQPRGRARIAFDTTSIAVSTVAACIGMWWSMANADPYWGAMWAQILATSVSYGLFLAGMTVAVIVRHFAFKPATAREARAP
jgi:hypothetical protein